MPEIKIYKTQDLVLQVKKKFNPAKLNLTQWDPFLDALCGDYEFQKEAIRDAIVYIASGEYASVEDLVAENWKTNPELRERYKDVREYQKQLQLPHKLSAVIDLATGTSTQIEARLFCLLSWELAVKFSLRSKLVAKALELN